VRGVKVNERQDTAPIPQLAQGVFPLCPESPPHNLFVRAAAAAGKPVGKRVVQASPSQALTFSGLAAIHAFAASSSGMPFSISVMTDEMSSPVHSNRVRMP